MYEFGITSRPILEGVPARLVVQSGDKNMRMIPLEQGRMISLRVWPERRHCVGWYDILAHENHPCESGRTIDPRFDACLDCRNRTGFNPAFYNAESISRAQATYNAQPHSVYVAYFGGGVAKVGIMSDSRGRERVYEQGALLYACLGSFPNAIRARQLEAELIEAGLKESVTKRMKEEGLRRRFEVAYEREVFAKLLAGLGVEYKGGIISSLDQFFYGAYPNELVTPVDEPEVSGRIVGVAGRYLVLENGGRLFGFWLSRAFGCEIEIGEDVRTMEAEPLQESLF